MISCHKSASVTGLEGKLALLEFHARSMIWSYPSPQSYHRHGCLIIVTNVEYTVLGAFKLPGSCQLIYRERGLELSKRIPTHAVCKVRSVDKYIFSCNTFDENGCTPCFILKQRREFSLLMQHSTRLS